MQFIRKNLRSIAVATVLSAACLLIAPAGFAATYQLPAGQEIMVKFKASGKISSGDVIAGVPLVIELAEPIMIGDKTIVEAGAEGKAIVKEAKKAGAPGKPGSITIEFTELSTKGAFKTVDGKPFKLEGSASHVGKGKKTLAFITIIGIVLIKGGQGELDTAKAYPAKIAETVVVTD